MAGKSIKVKYGTRLQYERDAIVNIGSEICVIGRDGMHYGIVTAFDYKDGREIVSYRMKDTQESRWAYPEQIQMVYA